MVTDIKTELTPKQLNVARMVLEEADTCCHTCEWRMKREEWMPAGYIALSEVQEL